MSFNIVNAFKGIQSAIQAPVKHLKSIFQPTGNRYNPQTNVTAQGFDEVSQEWQAMVAHNPFDLQTFTALENAQLANFGTVDNPLVIFTADTPFRYVGCTGPQKQDDYESHELYWLMLREGPLQRCTVCGQVFKLVRLRDQFSAQMDYYLPNFNQLPFEEMGEHDTASLISFHKANTHFEHTLFEQPEDTVYRLINPDEHDRMLVDPAYRMQKLTEAEMKANVYITAMDDYEDEVLANNPYREPISKVDYQNLIEAQALIKKFDRHFRKVAKFESRKYVDPVNHERREKRMQERARMRWDNSYTIFTGNLTEEEQKYKDYFQTDLQHYDEDERMEEFLDRQELLGSARYNLNKFDFQEAYTVSPEDDQSSYLEKKIFKFKYRRALDSQADYDRRNTRMIQAQKERFQLQNSDKIIANYLQNPLEYQKQYLDFINNEAILQYNDYFESQQDEYNNAIFENNKAILGVTFENWQLEKKDRSTMETFSLPQWNQELGWWGNAMCIFKEIQTVRAKVQQIQARKSNELTLPKK